MAASLWAPFVPLVLPTEQRGTERQPPYQDVPIASALAQLILLSRVVFFLYHHPSICLLLLGGGEMERNIGMREKQTGCLPYAPQLGTVPATQAYAQPGNGLATLWSLGQHPTH